ncbi:uncharacterized protein AAEQ78_014458 isoform 3-T6 [Lycaon pictus]
MLHVDWGKGVLQIQTGLAWSWRTCLSRMLSGGPDVAGPWTTQCSKSQVDNVKYMTTPPKGDDAQLELRGEAGARDKHLGSLVHKWDLSRRH